MRALRFEGGALRLAERERPEPRAGEVRVRTRLAGVCNTDLEIVRGYLGFEGTLGHEFVGEVVDGDPAWVGRRVCADINLACGECPTCAANDPHHCPSRTVLGIVGKDGAFADELTLPVRNLFEVPDAVSDEMAVFTEPLAAAYEILEQREVVGAEVLVLGDGKLGLLCALALLGGGARVTVLGRHAEKLAIASDAGATTCFETDARFDVVVEATGSPAGLAMAMDRVRPRGTIVLKSTFADMPKVDTNRLVIDEVQLLGSRCGPFDRALAALATGEVDPTPLISARRPLGEGVAAVELAKTRGTLKVLLIP